MFLKELHEGPMVQAAFISIVCFEVSQQVLVQMLRLMPLHGEVVGSILTGHMLACVWMCAWCGVAAPGISLALTLRVVHECKL